MRHRRVHNDEPRGARQSVHSSDSLALFFSGRNSFDDEHNMFAAGVAAAASAAAAAASSVATPASSSAPRFWRPGTVAPGSSVEREDASASAGDSASMLPLFGGSAVAGTSASRLTLPQQRMLLPVSGYRRQILWALERHAVLVCVGSTGSGKSTQIPQFLAEAGWTPPGRAVVITQPRRVAASTLAARVASEMSVPLGRQVGYSFRFEDVSSPETVIKFVTDGMLLREIGSDPLLSRYSVVMIDEAHERSVATDMLLGLLKKLLKVRRDLRVIISSATMDAERFAEFFRDEEWEGFGDDDEEDEGEEQRENVVLLTVEGRQFPVDVFYTAAPVSDYLRAAVDAAMHIARTQGPGDIFVFASGREEIEALIRTLREEAGEVGQPLQILPLYAGLSAELQLDVFAPCSLLGGRKVIVSTNVAEASVTIEGVGFVVDTGFAKVRAYDPTTGRSQLRVTPISQQSANQRSGRSGRTKKGVAYRLYTEAHFHTLMPARTPPELQRSNLLQVVLQLKSLGVANPLRFPWMDPPPLRLLAEALEMLYSMGALDAEARLTKVGASMADLPLEPNLARMLLYSAGVGIEPPVAFDAVGGGAVVASQRNKGSSVSATAASSSDSSSPRLCSEEILSIASMLCVDNLWLPTPLGVAARGKFDASRLHFAVHEGDHLSLLNIFNAFEEARGKDAGAIAHWAKRQNMNLRALLRARDIRRQLRNTLVRMGLPVQSCGGDSVAIRRAIIAGYFAQVARLCPDGQYRSVRDTAATTTRRNQNSSVSSLDDPSILYIHPLSVLHTLVTQSAAPKPGWLLYHELVHTSKPYMRELSVVDPKWLQQMAPQFYEIRTGHEAAAAKHAAIASAAANEAARGGEDTDGVIAEPDKKHRRLF